MRKLNEIVAAKSNFMERTKRKTELQTSDDAHTTSVGTGERSGVINARADERRLRENLETERDARLRLAAEYMNYRRRTEEEKAHSAEIGKRELLNEMLSIADDLDLAMEGIDELPEDISDGVRLIRRHFLDILESNGVVPFESLGEPFDPERHEAFDVVAVGDGKAGSVFKEVRRGYFWNDKLLRPALVVVAQ